ncbi:MAG: acyl--CoA ligase [Acidobacteria bacterium]|nr:acyl--CoA ligase [Acidobacteriota bacterium]
MPIIDAFARICRDTPGRVLVHHPSAGRTFTAEDLQALALGLAAELDRHGVTAGRLLLSTTGNHPALLAAWLACRGCGAAIMAIEPSTTELERLALADRFGAAAILALDEAPLTGFAVRVPGPCGTTLSVRVTLVDPEPNYDGAAVLKLTSGSTGASRVTFTTEAALLLDSQHIIEAMDVGVDDVQLAVIPLSHAYGVGNLLMPLLLQGTPCVLRESFVPPQLVADARHYGARIFPGVPFMFEHFVEHPPEEGWPRSLGRLIAAGAPLSSDTVQRGLTQFGVKIRAFYGTSETGGITFDATDDEIERGFVGYPLPGVDVTLRADRGVAAGMGRVFVRSEAVITRYVDAERDPSLVDGGFLSGDLGQFDRRGGLRLSGRVSAFLNVAGRKVSPNEVELVLRQLPAVTDARVLGLPDARRGQRLIACLVARAVAPSTVEIRRFCSERLAPYKIPRAFVFLDAIPLTDRGKTDHRRLTELAAAALEAMRDGML